ncbi:MAG: hypothetical protein RLY86_4358, partial [Pseudomonadota bacterium]
KQIRAGLSTRIYRTGVMELHVLPSIIDLAVRIGLGKDAAP